MIHGLSVYRAVNTLYLTYKIKPNQLMVY